MTDKGETMTTVSVGLTTIIGYLTSALAAIPVLITILEEGSAAIAINGPTKWAAIMSVVALAITQVGRYAQAHAQIKNQGK